MQRGGSSVRRLLHGDSGLRLQQTFALESYMVIHVGRGKVSSQPYAEGLDEWGPREVGKLPLPAWRSLSARMKLGA
jgi:hypothetical protein